MKVLNTTLVHLIHSDLVTIRQSNLAISIAGSIPILMMCKLRRQREFDGLVMFSRSTFIHLGKSEIGRGIKCCRSIADAAILPSRYTLLSTSVRFLFYFGIS